MGFYQRVHGPFLEGPAVIMVFVVEDALIVLHGLYIQIPIVVFHLYALNLLVPLELQ